jgi:pimeloyl-ACP methyl ester carboxylesterase
MMRRMLIALIVLAVIVLAANTYWVDSKTRAAAARDGGQIIDTPIVPANVRVEGGGPAIVLLHGFGAAIDWWDDIAPALATDHRLIRVDLIGHGGTAAPASGYSIERQAALVSAILDKLGVDRVTVIGHSLGGEVATALAEQQSERIERLIFIDSPATGGGTFTMLTKAYLLPVLGEFLSRLPGDRALRRGLAQGFRPGFAVPEKFLADIKQLTYIAFRTAHQDSIAYRTQNPPYERLATLKPVPPLLAIHGVLDAIVSPEQARFFERVPGGKVAMIEGAGHSPMVEKPAETLELIRGFLAQSESPP